jgi:16S rRNA (guanine527-N7)-methyltransferase
LEIERLRESLKPYTGEHDLTQSQLTKISTYINILTKWNERTNLTSVRDPEEIARRHFGESLFAAIHLLEADSTLRVIDVGSGAGFPGLVLKIYSPKVKLTLIEAHSKKNTFLREVVRMIGFTGVEVYLGRAEEFPDKADLVTLRAVEKFESILPVAGSLADVGGRLAAMIGSSQEAVAKQILPGAWLSPLGIPNSDSRIVLVRKNI